METTIHVMLYGCTLKEMMIEATQLTKAMRRIRLAASLSVLVGAAVASAQVRLPAFFQDHMVVQRNAPVHVWGYAAPGEAVSVSFRGATAHAVADDIGRWSIYLPPGAAGGPFEMDIPALRFRPKAAGTILQNGDFAWLSRRFSRKRASTTIPASLQH
jgi:hypothetical protein